MAKLYALKVYWKYSRKRIEELTNGCGPAGWKGWFIPDSILGVNIKEACNIHDFMYLVGESERDREKADRVFRNNMLRIVMEASKTRLTRWLRRKFVERYYKTVRSAGGTYFWEDKNEDCEFKDPKETLA